MKIQRLTGPPDAATGAALEEFERLFHYPLGDSRRFRISHGVDYAAFFQAMGDANILTAQRNSAVLGTLTYVRRSMVFRPAPGVEELRESHYFCDLKVRPENRGAAVLARLIAAAKAEIEPGALHACLSIVMDGTARSPLDYTGRLGVPRFQKLAELMILRFAARPVAALTDVATADATAEEVSRVQRRIAPPGFLLTGGNSAPRSLMTPVPLVAPGGLACGIVEDTRKAKRLFAESGEEMLSAHLSGFVYTTPAAGAALLRRAMAVTAAAGLPAMFVSVPRHEAGPLLAETGGHEVTLAPATVFGHDLPAGHDWRVDTAEI